MSQPVTDSLSRDEALFHFANKCQQKLFIWRQFEDCFKCPLVFWTAIDAQSEVVVKNSTNDALWWAITETKNSSDYLLSKEEKIFCKNQISPKDQSIHKISISGANHNFSCETQTLDDGRNNAWPLVVAAAVYVLLAVLFYGGRRLYWRYRARHVTQIASEEPDDKNEDKRRKRLKSLDCFRGITILMMIFVNVGAGGYEFLDHAPWDGFHFADIIFPWFIFIMGTTMAISLKSQVVRHKTPPKRIFFQIAKRSLTLFAIGLVLNSNGDANWRTLRIPGVLQRFGVSYLVVASSHALSLLLHKGELFGALRIHQLVDVIPYWFEWIVVALMTLLYTSLTFGWKFADNCLKGYVGPGGIADDMSAVACTGGAAAHIDRWLFTDKHLYQGFTARHLYDPKDEFHLIHDPEGVLGTTNSIILTFLGLQVGKILISFPNPRQRIVRWIAWGVGCGALAAALGASGLIPVNKNLWSLSFVLIPASAAFFAISLLYYLIDVRNVWPNGQPFHYPGMNSLILYIGHQVCGSMLPFTFNVDEGDHVGPLARDLWTTTMWFIVSVRLAQNDFFFTV